MRSIYQTTLETRTLWYDMRYSWVKTRGEGEQDNSNNKKKNKKLRQIIILHILHQFDMQKKNKLKVIESFNYSIVVSIGKSREIH